jgi:pilus assembly protein CpaB
MNNNETRTLWISVGAALGAVFLLYSYTQEKSSELTKKFGVKERVVIAKKDIQEMETITEDMLEVTERPVDFIEPQALKSPDTAIGLVALAPIKKDEQVLESKIMEPGPVTGLSLQVAPTKRAVTIPIDEVRGVAKLLKPGDRIDIVAALDIGKGAAARREIKTLMQDVPILATGLKVVNELPRLFEKVGRDDFIRNLRGDTNFNSITVEVTPKEAQDLIYILSTSPGSLFMTLRHPSDHTKSPMATSSVESLMGRVPASVLSSQMDNDVVQVPRMTLPPPAPAKAPVNRPKRSGQFIDL